MCVQPHLSLKHLGKVPDFFLPTVFEVNGSELYIPFDKDPEGDQSDFGPTKTAVDWHVYTNSERVSVRACGDRVPQWSASTNGIVYFPSDSKDKFGNSSTKVVMMFTEADCTFAMPGLEFGRDEILGGAAATNMLILFTLHCANVYVNSTFVASREFDAAISGVAMSDKHIVVATKDNVITVFDRDCKESFQISDVEAWKVAVNGGLLAVYANMLVKVIDLNARSEVGELQLQCGVHCVKAFGQSSFVLLQTDGCMQVVA